MTLHNNGYRQLQVIGSATPSVSFQFVVATASLSMVLLEHDIGIVWSDPFVILLYYFVLGQISSTDVHLGGKRTYKLARKMTVSLDHSLPGTG